MYLGFRNHWFTFVRNNLLGYVRMKQRLHSIKEWLGSEKLARNLLAFLWSGWIVKENLWRTTKDFLCF